MKIQTIKSDKDETKFVIDGVKPSFVNVLRRACGFEVPLLAIDDVYFTKNSSALYDEIIAHRLGLIPLKTDLKIYEPQDGCSCKGNGCAKCQVSLKLSLKGPRMVYAGDLQSQDPSVKPIYPKMVIVELINDQELEFEAIAKVGKGKKHMKWSPCLSFYHKYPTSKIKGPAAKVLKGVPKGLFDAKGNIADLSQYDLCQYYAEKSNGAIEITTADNKFIFTVESWGQLSAKEILKEAVKIVQQKIKKVKLK